MSYVYQTRNEKRKEKSIKSTAQMVRERMADDARSVVPEPGRHMFVHVVQQKQEIQLRNLSPYEGRAPIQLKNHLYSISNVIQRHCKKCGDADCDGSECQDPDFKPSARQMYYPSTFALGVKEAVFKRDAGVTDITSSTTANCKGPCKKPLKFKDSDTTYDHIISAVEHFNKGGYKMTQQQRREWYNNTSNLQVMCKSCNSSKGGNGTYRNDVIVKF